MRKVLQLALREYISSVKTKGFIIGLILAPLMMGGSLIAFALLKDRVDTTEKKFAVIDRSGEIAGYLAEAVEKRNAEEIFDKESGRKIKPAYFIEIVPPDESDPRAQLLSLSDRVRKGELHAFVDIGRDVVHPGEDPATARIAYYAKNAALDDLRGWIVWPVNDRLRQVRLEDAGIEKEKVQDLFFWVNVEGLGLVSLDEGTGDISDGKKASEIEAIIVPIIMMMLMFLMIMMSVPGMLHSVMEEKTQRIAEVLLGSVSPFGFMIGKVLGGIAVSLTSSAVYVTGGIIAVRYMHLEHFIPYQALPWFFAYMLLAIVMFGSYAAALGSACSEPKDAQSLSFPVMLPALFPMFVYFPVVREPVSPLATVLSLIPPFTPLLMLIRQSTPEQIPVWQPVAGLAGMLALTVLLVWAGGRLFRVAILMQGTPPRLSNLLRWAFRG
ncbi:ABC transporter permease [bacterium]|nr:ABC transporter permease [bacterium]